MTPLNPELVRYIIENTPYGDNSVYQLFNFATTPDIIENLVEKGLDLKKIKISNLIQRPENYLIIKPVINNENLLFLMEKCFFADKDHYLLFLKNEKISPDLLKKIIKQYNIDPFEQIIMPAILNVHLQTRDILHMIDILDLPLNQTFDFLKNKGVRLVIGKDSKDSHLLSKLNNNYKDDHEIINFLFGPEFNFYLYHQNIIDLETLFLRVNPYTNKRNIDTWINSKISIPYEEIIESSLSIDKKEFLIKTLISYSDVIYNKKNNDNQQNILNLIEKIPAELINIADKEDENILFILKYDVENFDLFESLLNSLHKKGFDFSKEINSKLFYLSHYMNHVFYNVDEVKWSEFTIKTINFFYEEKENISPQIISKINERLIGLNLVSKGYDDIFERCVIDHIKNKLNNIITINSETKPINRI